MLCISGWESPDNWNCLLKKPTPGSLEENIREDKLHSLGVQAENPE